MRGSFAQVGQLYPLARLSVLNATHPGWLHASRRVGAVQRGAKISRLLIHGIDAPRISATSPQMWDALASNEPDKPWKKTALVMPCPASQYKYVSGPSPYTHIAAGSANHSTRITKIDLGPLHCPGVRHPTRLESGSQVKANTALRKARLTAVLRSRTTAFDRCPDLIYR